MDPFCHVFYVIIILFFSFFCKNVNITGSNCGIIDYNLSKKHKLALSETKSGEPNYIDHKILL